MIGGGVVGQDLTHPDLEVEAGDQSLSDKVDDQSLGVSILGVVLDWFPDPKGGAHVGLLIGPANIGLQDEDGNSASGAGAALFGGYDFWVGDQWSFGAEARILAAAADHTRLGNAFDDTATGYHLSFTALLH